jgi:hypothetical protein
MAKPSGNWKLRLFPLSLLAGLVATSATGAGCSSEDETAACESTEDYFAKEVWPIVESRCMACHNVAGIANKTSYVLKSSAEAGFVQHNIEVIKNLALNETDGQSRWLLKPTNSIPHEGGLQVLKESDEYKKMLGFVVRLKDDQPCVEDEFGKFTGVEVKDARATYRSAALLIGRRLPTEEEYARIEQGGDQALSQLLDELMTEEAFYEFLKSSYGDVFQTDFYLTNDAAGAISEIYADGNWYETAQKEVVDQYGLRDLDELERFTNLSIAREPLELVKWVAKNNLPFSDIVEADYTMFSPLSQRSYGAEMLEDFENPNDPLEFKPGRLPAYADNGAAYTEYPHAGVLSSPMFLNRWPTTPTNRNRARARVTMLFFLGTNILRAAARPLDQTKVTVLNPQRDDPACAVCHTTVDAFAGLWQAFQPYEDGDGNATWKQEPQWFSEMWPPAFGDDQLPVPQAAVGVQFLGKHIARDERFAISVVQTLYTGLTGREPLLAPDDYADPLYGARVEGFLHQSNSFQHIASHFRETNYNVKTVVKDLVLSPYFRALNSVPLSEEQLVSMGDVGAARFLTPEQLHFKVRAVLGTPWGSSNDPYLSNPPRDPGRTGDYQLYYGGVDFSDVSSRIGDPNGLMAAVAERMAVEMACVSVPADFSRADDERILFKNIEIDGRDNDPINLQPESDGIPVPGAQQGIKQTIVNLMERVLGERLNVDHPEVERAYQLFVETWREGTEKIDDGQIGTELPYACAAYEDLTTGQPLPEDQQVTQDEKYTVRAWMAVMTYLLSDFRFLYE